MIESPHLYVVAGPNGAGKSTFALRYLPQFARCQRFVNADLIASGLSPLAPEAAAMRAGRFMLEEINRLAKRLESFGFETTLSGQAYAKLLKKLKETGYYVHLYFIWLPDVE